MSSTRLAIDVFCATLPYGFCTWLSWGAARLGAPIKKLHHGRCVAICAAYLFLFIGLDFQVVPQFWRFPCSTGLSVALYFVWGDDDDHRGGRRRRLREALKRVRSWAVFGFPLGRQPA